LGFRTVRAVEALVKHVIRERPQNTTGLPRTDGSVAPNSTSSRAKTPKVVAELPPDVIAPNIRKPPKSRGGFGSHVRTNDDIQIQSSDRDAAGSQSGGGSTDQDISGPAQADQ